MQIAIKCIGKFSLDKWESAQIIGHFQKTVKN
jgi:hypothetical protein